MHKPSVVLWTLEDCIACPSAKELVKKFCTEKKLRLRVLDPTEEPALAQQHGVKLVPHVTFTDASGECLSIAGVVRQQDLVKLFAATTHATHREPQTTTGVSKAARA